MRLKNDSVKPQNERKLWGRRQNRPLGGDRKEAMQTVFPQIEIKANDLSGNHSLDTKALFKDTPQKLWLEIGFGGGEHVIGLLERHADVSMLACEPFINGMASFVKDLPNDHIPRVRALMDDAMLLARSLEQNSLDRIYVLNPDPWHKKRHHKRRIISSENLDVFAKILKPGGQLIMTTDVPDLADWMITHTYKHPSFSWNAQSQENWSKKPDDWITTRYQIKGAKGSSKMCYLFFTCQK